MTFSEWFMKVDPNVDCSIHDMVWEGDYTKARDLINLIEESFEAGYNACIDEILSSREASDGGEIHKKTLEDVKI